MIYVDMYICLNLQVFMGNQNHDTPEVRSFKPLTMRFLRVYPERGSHEGMALRLELLGCDTQCEEQPTSTQTTSLDITNKFSSFPVLINYFIMAEFRLHRI